MATEVGLSQSQYSRIENGESAVSFEKVIEISRVLNVSPYEIIDYGSNQTFNNCNQSGNNHSTITNNQDFTEERKELLEQIKYLQEQNTELLKIIQNLKTP